MRAFVAALAAVLIIATISIYALGIVQESSGAAYSTNGTRVTAHSLRGRMRASMEKVGMKKNITNTGTLNTSTMSGDGGGGDTCAEISAWQMILVDFRNKSEDEAACHP